MQDASDEDNLGSAAQDGDEPKNKSAKPNNDENLGFAPQDLT